MPAHFTPSARIRRSPFFDATVAEGVTSFTVYNHMYMPTAYGDPMGEYWRLIRGVAMWDVACERQVELVGEDAGRLAQILCPRKLGNMKVGQGWYVPVCDHNGVLLNDPILLKLAEDRYWLSIADGDLLLWAKAVAAERSLDVTVREPDVSPLAVQGPKAIEVIVDLFGDAARSMAYFRFRDGTRSRRRARLTISAPAARTAWNGSRAACCPSAAIPMPRPTPSRSAWAITFISTRQMTASASARCAPSTTAGRSATSWAWCCTMTRKCRSTTCTRRSSGTPLRWAR
jgi:hypothetical protein